MLSSNSIPGMYLLERAVNSEITLVNVTMFNNSNGGLKILTGNESIWLNILSSSFSYNTNGALMLQLSKQSDHCNIVITNFTRNKGISDGVAMYIYMLNNNIDINISHCKFDSSTGDSKIVYAALYMPVQLLGNTQGKIYASFCSFIHNKIGSTLHLSQMLLKFYDSNLFQSNSARSGITIYFEQNSQVTIDNIQLYNLLPTLPQYMVELYMQMWKTVIIMEQSLSTFQITILLLLLTI